MNPGITSIPPDPALDLPAPVSLRKRARPHVWIGLVMVCASLGLILLGGCFLIGVLEIVRMRARMTGHEIVTSGIDQLSATLYVAAYSCFLAAVVILFLAVRGLYRALQERVGS
jgi:hypothetical protein